jgi:hypothetical protein
MTFGVPTETQSAWAEARPDGDALAADRATSPPRQSPAWNDRFLDLPESPPCAEHGTSYRSGLKKSRRILARRAGSAMAGK